jgi:hypothetical protein
VIESNVREICGRRAPDKRLSTRALCHRSDPHTDHDAVIDTAHSFGGKRMPPKTRYGWRDGDTTVVVLSDSTGL